MSPETGNALRNAWLAFGGAVIVSLVGLWWVSDDGVSVETMERLANQCQGLKGDAEAMRRLVNEERLATNRMIVHLEDMRAKMGFTLNPRFRVKEGVQRGELGAEFQALLDTVEADLRSKAENRIHQYDAPIGFEDITAAPPASNGEDLRQLYFLHRMLQLTERAVDIALSTERPLRRIEISHGNRPRAISANGRVVWREYPLTMNLRGGLKEILWVLHMLNNPDPESSLELGRDPQDHFPFVVHDFSITSRNRRATDAIQELDVRIEFAALDFSDAPDIAVESVSAPSGGGGGAAVIKARH